MPIVVHVDCILVIHIVVVVVVLGGHVRGNVVKRGKLGGGEGVVGVVAKHDLGLHVIGGRCERTSVRSAP